MIREILRILEGETESLRGEVEERMQEASRELRFEEAARLRDVGRGLETIAREQRVHKVQGKDQDVLALARDGDLATGVALRIRRGLLLGRETQRFSDASAEEDSALLSAFVSRYYLGRGEEGCLDLPREVLLPVDFEDRPLLEEVLSDRAGTEGPIGGPEEGGQTPAGGAGRIECQECHGRSGVGHGSTWEIGPTKSSTNSRTDWTSRWSPGSWSVSTSPTSREPTRWGAS